MTTEYKTLRVPADDYEKARESKEESETWGEFLQRCSENPPETVEFIEASESNEVELEATEYEKIAREVAEQLR
jgi:hypothetical protein